MDLVEFNRFKVVLESVRRLLHRGATPNLRNILSKLHPADVAQLFKFLSPAETYQLFDVLDDHEQAAQVLKEALPEHRMIILERIDKERLSQILNALPSDDATDILEDLPEDLRAEIIARLGIRQSASVEEHLSYPEGSAGRVMVTHFLALPEDMTIADAIEEVRRAKKSEVFYVYVVDDEKRLKGVLSLRQLVMANPSSRLGEIMVTDVVKVPPTADQEDVAKIVARYNLIAVPVVDSEEKLIGIVTVDDVIDIMREEATEDLLKLAGTAEEDITTSSSLKSVRLRFPWLMITWVGGILSSVVVAAFSPTIERFVYVAAFMPIIAGMAGNVGSQSVAVVIRGLATGRIDTSQLWKILFKEVRSGILLGIAYGILLAAFAWVRFGSPLLGASVGISVCAAMTLSASWGTLLPLAASKLGADPAFISGPFMATTTDVAAMAIYLGVATALLNI
ncbi:MAG TPA: magnesium transporter [Proteobacteria bacterium]|nr:magnesium transporter [Pseudomonadota bacterium]